MTYQRPESVSAEASLDVVPAKNQRVTSVSRERWLAVAFFFLMGCISANLYRSPEWDMDMTGYLGNALLTNNTPVAKAHQLIYADVERLPENARLALLGLNEAGDPTQHASRKARAESVGPFAEFLPCFAIRPAYNQLLFLVTRVFGLTRGAVLLSVCSYFLLGLLVFLWSSRYVRAEFAAAFSLLLMLMPPMTAVGRRVSSDALSTLLAVFALYLLFETKRELAGLIVLLASIFVRTDNVVLVAPVLVALFLCKRLAFWQMSVLGILSAACVLFINRMAGDYGLQMLYYRNFIGTPVAPADVVVHFSLRQYVHFFRSGLTAASQGWLVPFMFLAVVGLYRKSHLRLLSAIGLPYVALHYLLLPNWLERWFVVAYIPMALSAVCVEEFRGRGALPSIDDQSTVTGAQLLRA